MRRAFTLFLLFVFTTTQVFGWSDAGHKIVASIAYSRLTSGERSQLIRILKQHPRFQEDFERRVPEDVDDETIDEWRFQQASIWPDLVKSLPNDLREHYSHPQWHYINVPHFLTEADQAALEGRISVNLKLIPPTWPKDDMNVIQTIRYARNVLANNQADEQSKALMLAWLIHTVGDIHQPLHSTALFSRNQFPHGDKGGNSIKTTQHGELHAVWDQFPGGRVQFKTAHDRARSLLTKPGMANLGQAAAQDLDEANWLDESHTLAKMVVYDPEVLVALRGLESDPGEQHTRPITLSDEYLSAGGKIAQQRLVQAGFRLGAVLKAITE